MIPEEEQPVAMAATFQNKKNILINEATE